jgi:hypothetical protein
MWEIKKIIHTIKNTFFIFFLVCIISSQSLSLVVTNSNNISKEKDIINQNDVSNFRKDYRAVLIGINDYPGFAGDLPYSINEITSFKKTLINKGNWIESDIIMIKDNEANHSNITNTLEWLGEQESSLDVSIIYFVGHGGKIDKNYTFSAYDKKIFDYELDEIFDSYDGRIILILDCCHSGGFIEKVKGRGRMIMAACDKDGLTYQYDSLKSGFFGYFLNFTLEKLTYTAEATFLIAALLTYFYSLEVSKEYGEDYVVKPKASDRTIGSIRLIRPRFLNYLYKGSYIDLVPPVSESTKGHLWVL